MKKQILSFAVSLWKRSQSDVVEEFARPANLFAESFLEYYLLFAKLRMTRYFFYLWMLGAVVTLSPSALAQTDQPIYTDSLVRDRKSTRLNSSHLGISYAVFC